MESEPTFNSKGKIPSTGGSEEGRTRNRTVEQRVQHTTDWSVPPPSPSPLPPQGLFVGYLTSQRMYLRDWSAQF